VTTLPGGSSSEGRWLRDSHKQVSLHLQGLIPEGKTIVRKRGLLTNPSSCQPATVLEITTYEIDPPTINQSSVFTPTGC
jgi:hypothetical protein